MILQWDHPYFLQQQQKLCGWQTSSGTPELRHAPECPIFSISRGGSFRKVPSPAEQLTRLDKGLFSSQYCREQPTTTSTPSLKVETQSSPDHHQAALSSPRPVWDFSLCCFFLTFWSITCCPKNLLSFSVLPSLLHYHPALPQQSSAKTSPTDENLPGILSPALWRETPFSPMERGMH